MFGFTSIMDSETARTSRKVMWEGQEVRVNSESILTKQNLCTPSISDSSHSTCGAGASKTEVDKRGKGSG